MGVLSSWAWLCVACQASRLAISWLARRHLVVSTSHGQPNDPRRVASTGVRNDDPVERHRPRSEHQATAPLQGRLSVRLKSQRTKAWGSDLTMQIAFVVLRRTR